MQNNVRKANSFLQNTEKSDQDQLLYYKAGQFFLKNIKHKTVNMINFSRQLNLKKMD